MSGYLAGRLRHRWRRTHADVPIPIIILIALFTH